MFKRLLVLILVMYFADTNAQVMYELGFTDTGVSMTDTKLCNVCGSEEVIPARYNIGYRTCLKCGEVMAGKRKFTVVPMHKSNYVVISNKKELKGINNKGGLYE